MKRLDRTAYYMQMAALVAKRSTCLRASVGAVLVAQNRVVATGYNGSGPSERHCIDKGCLIHEGHCIRTTHAEMNAILHLNERHPGMVLFCTHKPCVSCLKALMSIRVTEINYIHEYEDEARELVYNDSFYPPVYRRHDISILEELK